MAFVSLGLAGALLTGGTLLALHGYSLCEQSLRRGVDFLLGHELGARYRVEDEFLRAGGFDPSGGEWWVALETDPGDLLAKLRAHPKLREPSWSSGALVSDGAGVHYFRGALNLGEGSICPEGRAECGVELRLEEGQRSVYVTLWKP